MFQIAVFQACADSSVLGDTAKREIVTLVLLCWALAGIDTVGLSVF